jgi:hypothetical protein
MANTDILTRLRNVEERRPAIVASAAALLTGGIVIGAILLQGRETQTAPEPSLTFHQCGSMQDNTSRLACYDEVAYGPSSNRKRVPYTRSNWCNDNSYVASCSAPAT